MTKRSKLLLVLACTMYALFSVLETLCVYFLAKIMECAERGDLQAMGRTVALTLGLWALTYLLTAAGTIVRLAFLSDSILSLRSDIIQSILRRPLQSFRGQNDGYYINLLSADVDLYSQDRLNLIPFAFACVSAVVSAAAMLFMLNRWLFLAGVALSLLPVATSNLFTNATRKRKTQMSQATESYMNVLREGIEGYEAIRMGGGQEPFTERFRAASARKQRAYSASAAANQISFTVLCSMSSLLNIACMGIGGYLAVQGQLSASMLFAACSYFTGLSNGFTNMLEYVINIRSTKNLAEKLTAERTVPASQGSAAVHDDAPLVAYDNVSFSFGERQLYRDLSCEFRPGGCYAVVGESGSGKSTLTKLLLKYYDGYTGAITLGGQDIRTLPEDELYRTIGTVSQTPFLFNASLYDNITFFSRTPAQDSEAYRQLLSDLNLTALAQRVGDASLGDFGDNISGGERQRICIARTIRNHPPILIFDEPTTGLDPENVALIEEFIFRHRSATRIVISHNWDPAYLDRFDGVVRIG